MNQIYRKRAYVIFRVCDGYIVYNTNKQFQYGHTHITNINTAKWLINLSIYGRVPDKMSDYLLESLIRISESDKYIKKIKELRKIQKNRKGAQNEKIHWNKSDSGRKNDKRNLL